MVSKKIVLAAVASAALVVPASASAATAVPSSYKSCGMVVYDDAIYAGGVTSCPFARNVYRAIRSQLYWNASGRVVARSPATGRSYSMRCHFRGYMTRCTGGNNARVDIFW
jgi:hypothetical protein